MAAPASTSLIDRVDPRDRPVGVVTRKDALAEGANFRTAHVFIFDRRGRLLLQRLAPTRERHPGRWGSSVAAYLFAGERYAAAARRRMGEELGLAGTPIPLGKVRMRDERSMKFIGLFEFRADVAEIRDPDHIAELKFWDLENLDTSTVSKPAEFTPTFLRLYSFYRRDELTPLA